MQIDVGELEAKYIHGAYVADAAIGKALTAEGFNLAPTVGPVFFFTTAAAAISRSRGNQAAALSTVSLIPLNFWQIPSTSLGSRKAETARHRRCATQSLLLEG